MTAYEHSRRLRGRGAPQVPVYEPPVALPGALQDHQARQAMVDPEEGPSAFCDLGGYERGPGEPGTAEALVKVWPPHDAHHYGEGLQAYCGGQPGLIPATSYAEAAEEVQAALDRVHAAERRLLDAQRAVLGAYAAHQRAELIAGFCRAQEQA